VGSQRLIASAMARSLNVYTRPEYKSQKRETQQVPQDVPTKVEFQNCFDGSRRKLSFDLTLGPKRPFSTIKKPFVKNICMTVSGVSRSKIVSFAC
jgi:hypothetical protein